MNRVKQLVHAENVYRMGYTGKNIRVVTLDTGVYLHPDLRQNVVGFLDFVAMTCVSIRITVANPNHADDIQTSKTSRT